jgi:ribosomal protein L40E
MSGLDSYCGIYCGACLCNIVKENGTIEETAKKLKRSIEQLTCTECKTALHQDCCFVTCCTSKDLNNCSECSEMPCAEITKFANDGYKHHATVIPNLMRIREIGLDEWLKEQKEKHKCPKCGARTGWSYTSCEKCEFELQG